MEKGNLILDLGLGDGLFREAESEGIDKEELEIISAEKRETAGRDQKRKRKEMMHGDEEQFLKLSLHRSVICESEFPNGEESMEGRNIQRARSIEEGDQIPAAICSSSNIKSGDSRSKNDHDQANNLFETEREDGVARKKLRLSRDQAASLEESFKKHSTLNPKQKLALAKQLNLKPRQVEVWFQNRRARTKLKKTEMDYEYLKRWCHMLTLENRRLQREVTELRMLRRNAATHPFYMHVNPSLCPSYKHTNVSSSASVATVTAFGNQPNSFAALLSKPGFSQIVTAWQ